MNALAIHLYLIIRYINLSFNYFCNFYRIIVLGLFFVLAMFVALTIIAYISDCKKLAGLCAIAALAIIVLACYYMPKLSRTSIS